MSRERQVLAKLEQFAHFIHLLHDVDRVARTPGAERFSNTAEHSFQVAFLAWFVLDTLNLPLDREKVLRYALAHDVIEAYAGDTYIYDTKARETKERREREAFEKVRENFSEFSSLIETVDAYEKRGDEESKFVYALDKLIDPLNITMEEGRSLWKECGVSYDDIRSYKDKKIATSEYIDPYWKQLLEKIEKNKSLYFDI